ncbi:MAG: carbamoyl-phosphate synthase large subunit [Erysipelotrichaceae bacterium]
MPKRKDLHKIMIIGSGPIIIGQAAEFDYAGTQACLSLKEEGYEVVLVNSNPATIMTDPNIADKIYMEPLTLEYVAKIIRKERPDAIVPSLGGQTGLNLVVQLAKKGVLAECQVEVLGTSFTSIEKAEDRDLFKQLCISINEPVLPSAIANTIEEVSMKAQEIGYPVILRPAFTLGGSGGGFAHNQQEAQALAESALSLSPVSQVLVEKSIKGYKEIEYEVIRDANDTAISICNMENFDPVGIHTGDSIVCCPSQTLTNKEYQMLRNSALKIIRTLKIEGGCNVQFAIDPYSFQYYVIEVNPRVSRSSALASKASGYPIARVSAKIAIGMHLDEIQIANTPASFEPALDYIVTKIARFPFDKFASANNTLSTQMKATGEVMSIGRTFEESLLKAIRSLEIGTSHILLSKFNDYTTAQLLSYIVTPTDDRIFALAELLRRKTSMMKISQLTSIDLFFIDKINNIILMEEKLANNADNQTVFQEAKALGFSDQYLANLLKTTELEVYQYRIKHGIFPVYKMIDTCASEFSSYIPYFYSTYESENEVVLTEKKSIIVLGSGPIRIGQGVEFDYSTVHAIWAIKELGYEAIVINNNPETVSTDYTTSDKLYFEPLTTEDVMNIINLEKPLGVIVSLGGQTAINLADSLEQLNVPIIGTNTTAITAAEDRDIFEKILTKLNIPKPAGHAVKSLSDGIKVAKKIGFPVLVRPSFVLGGRAMQIVNNTTELTNYLNTAVNLNKEHPVLVDKYLRGKEVEVDAICDGDIVLIPGIMELIEETGIHSGDSMSVYPPFSLSDETKNKIIDYTTKLALALGIKGLFNIQFIVSDDDVYIIEVNPRSSRSVPFLSKVTNVAMANIATKVMLNQSLKEQGFKGGLLKDQKKYYVKAPTFSFSKLSGLDAILSPEMKSTGEAIGYDYSLNRALFKALKASNMRVENYGTVFVTIADNDKDRALPLINRFYELGFNIEATTGTAKYLKDNNIKTRTRAKISENSEAIVQLLRSKNVAYVINTLSPTNTTNSNDGYLIRRLAVENNVPIFTSLETVKVLLNVLEEITDKVAIINE